MSTRLSRPSEDVFIEDALLPLWEPAGAVGFDVALSDPSQDAFMPVGKSLDDVGAVYPHLTVQETNQTAPNDTSYSFLTEDGPGQTRTGQLLVTARAEDKDDGYTGDADTHTAVDAQTLVRTLRQAVEDTALEAERNDTTEFSFIGSSPAADVPDDFGAEPTVRQAQVTIPFGWIREP